MYPCVPLVDRHFSISGSILATPKSDSLTQPLEYRRMFSGFTSTKNGTYDLGYKVYHVTMKFHLPRCSIERL